MNFQAWVSAWLLCLILAGVLIFGLTGCVTTPASIPVVSIYNSADNVWWINKASGKKVDQKDMDGYFSLSPSDFSHVLGRLNQCHEE